MGQFKWDHKILCLSSFTTLHILSEIESHVTSFSQFTLVSWSVVVMHLLFPLCSHYFLILGFAPACFLCFDLVLDVVLFEFGLSAYY